MASRQREVPRAYIVTTESSVNKEVLEKEIIDWFNARVAKHKILRGGVRFVDEIPKTASGKIMRRVLKERAARRPGETLMSGCGR